MQERRILAGVVAMLLMLFLLPVLSTTTAGASTTTTVTSTPGSTWGVFAPCPSKPSENCGAIYSIVDAGGVVYIGGSFTELISPNGKQSLPYHNLAAITESTGQPDTAFGPHTFNGPVDALAVSPDGSELYAGGQFTTIDGSTAHAQYLAAFSSGNGAHLAFPGSTNGAVYALLTSGTSLYVGGVFWRADGQWQPHAAELDASSGALDKAFAPQIAYSGPTSPCDSRFACRASVHSFYLGTDANGAPTLYLGGEFTSVGGQARFDLAAVDPSTGAVTSYDPHIIQNQDDAMDWVSQVVQDGSEVVAGEAGYNNILIAFALSGRTNWYDNTSGDIQAVAVDSSGEIYAGGHFTCFLCSQPPTPPPTGPNERIHLARVSPVNGALDSTWAPFYEPWWTPYFFGVWALDITPDGHLWAGGEGTYIETNGLTYPAPKLAVFGGPSGQAATPPSPPTGLKASPGNTTVSLSWQPSSSDGGSAITGYDVYRSTKKGALGTKVASDISGTTYTDTGLTNGDTYWYEVTAVNAVGQSAPSNQVSATPLAPLVPAPGLTVGAAQAPNGEEMVAVTTSKGSVAVATWVPGGKWSSARDIGGRALGGPAVVSPATGSFEVFVRGGNDAVWEIRDVNGSWGNWASLGGRVSASPGAAVNGSSIEVVGVDGRGHIWERLADRTSRWWKVGGTLYRGTAPAAAAVSAGHLAVFGVGTDKALWFHLDGRWHDLKGTSTATPGASSPFSGGYLEAFVRGSNGALYHRSGYGASWSGWSTLGGVLANGPAVAFRQGSDRQDVYAVGTNDRVWHLSSLSGHWGSWAQVP